MITDGQMGKVNLPYVHSFRDRHGKQRAYFRHKGRRWKLPAPDAPEFTDTYRRILETVIGDAVQPTDNKYTLSWLIQQYQGSPEFLQLSAATQTQYKRILSDIAARHALKSWRTLTKAAVIKHIRDPFAATPRKADTYVSITAALYRWAIIRELITSNPAHGVPKLYKTRGGHRAWTRDEAERFCVACSELEYRIFALALYTGQRAGDLTKLTWFQYDGATIRLTQSKTGRSLTLNVHPTLKRLLDAMERHDGTILVNAKGQPFDRPTLSTVFSVAVRRMGLRGCTLHGLRSTHATWIAEEGGSEHQIGASTGHRSPSMVRRYTESADQQRLAGQGISLLPDMPRTLSGKP